MISTMNSILSRNHLVLLGIVLIIVAIFTNAEFLRKYTPSDSGPWKKYENFRFGYSINYPSDWTEGHIANNGDGRVLHNKDSNEITVYGSHEPTDFSKSYPGSVKSTVKLTSGQQVIVYESRADERVMMIVVFDTKEDQIVLYSNTKDNYYRANRDTIIEVADTFKLQIDQSL